MYKIVNPAICDVYNSKASAYAEITFENGNLSICGVIGPRASGNCKGSCGQCYEEISQGTPAKGWNNDMLKKFCEIWQKWHLNDMHLSCEHQRDLGWEDEAREQVTIYHYVLTNDAYKKKKDAEQSAIDALRKGKVFRPSIEQTKYATLPYHAKSFGKEIDSPDYKKRNPLYAGDTGAIETKCRGHIRFDENEVGILCKPCPVCGYKYGTAWKKIEVPQEIIEWLFNLPETDEKPAWI